MANSISTLDVGTPAIAGTFHIGGGVVCSGNIFSAEVLFDSAAATWLSADAGADGRQMLGVNTATPEASLHIAHGARVDRPAVLLTQAEPDFRLYEEHILTANPPFKQLVRRRTPLLPSPEPGTVTVLESIRVGSLADLPPAVPAFVCGFKVPPLSNLLARFRIVARSDRGDVASWSGHQSFHRHEAGLVGEPAALIPDSSLRAPAPPAFPALGEPGAPVFEVRRDPVSGLDVTLGLSLPPLPLVDTAWQAELDVLMISAANTTGTVSGATLAGGVLTIAGAGLLSHACDSTQVLVTGGRAVELLDTAIVAGGGSVSDTAITIPEGMLPPLPPGAAPDPSFVKVRANQQLLNRMPKLIEVI